IYTYFYELGFNVLKDRGGVLSYITSNKYTRAGYGEALREFLLKNVKFLEYTDLNGIKVFDSATVDTSILCFEKSKSKDNKFKYLALSNEILKTCAYDIGLYKDFAEFSQNSLSKESFTFSDENTSALKAKIERIGTPLKEWYGLNINYGIKTGYNEAFIITTEKRNEILANCKDEAEKERTAKLIRKMLRGRDIKRYSYEWAGLWVINTHNGYKNQNGEKVEAINIKHYPSLKKHFDEFYPQLEKRADKGLTPYNLRNCAYLDEFEKEKIVWNPVSGEYLFSYIKEHIFFNNSLFMMTLDVFSLKYILAFMNSNCYKWLITLKTNLIQTGSYAYGAKDKIERLPIPKINSKNEKLANELINLVDEILKAKEQDKNANTQELENKINSIVYKLYNLTEEEIKIIEGK
ncbi:Eco57I restriction-modification methylase domain-containing protein, partial [Campylobacter jejuni]|nr:Eco57I restriction-modification methylase domain-containing protein [Campylobacter jejuni]